MSFGVWCSIQLIVQSSEANANTKTRWMCSHSVPMVGVDLPRDSSLTKVGNSFGKSTSNVTAMILCGPCCGNKMVGVGLDPAVHLTSPRYCNKYNERCTPLWIDWFLSLLAQIWIRFCFLLLQWLAIFPGPSPRRMEWDLPSIFPGQHRLCGVGAPSATFHCPCPAVQSHHLPHYCTMERILQDNPELLRCFSQETVNKVKFILSG